MPEFVKQPYLQWPLKQSMTIMWETSEECTSTVRYFETERVHSGLSGRFRTLPDSEKQVEEPVPSLIHRITLHGLEPDTTYHYRVVSVDARGETVESEKFPLRTAVQEDTPFSFAVTSETGGFGDDGINRGIFDRIKRYRPDFLLLVGDAVRNGSRYEDWEKYFFGPGKELFGSTPFYLCPGNHEENA